MTATAWQGGTRRTIRAAASPGAMSRLAQILFVLAVLVLFTVSGGMLWLVGYNYDGLAGSAVTKIHPGSYLVFLAFALAALEAGNPVGFAVSAFVQRPASLFLLATALLVFADIIYRSGPGMAGIIDTYMLPGFVAVLFMTSDRTTRGRLEVVIHAALICNALLGLVEFGTKHLYFPYRFDGVFFELDTRSTALQGHPLGNATMTAVYILALLGGGGSLSTPIRAGVIALECMALVAFGGRSATVTVAVFGTLAGLRALHRTLRSGRVNLLGAAATILLLTAVPLVLTGLAAGGFFDLLLTRFVSDGGSANARVEMITLLQEIPLGDLLIGPDAALVDSLRRVNGLEQGIENPIIRTLVYQGAFITVLLIAAVGAFLAEIGRRSGRGLLLPMLGFVIIVNTFESLASKSTMLAKFALLILILFRPDRTLPVGGAPPAGARPRRLPALSPRPVARTPAHDAAT